MSFADCLFFAANQVLHEQLICEVRRRRVTEQICCAAVFAADRASELLFNLLARADCAIFMLQTRRHFLILQKLKEQLQLVELAA